MPHNEGVRSLVPLLVRRAYGRAFRAINLRRYARREVRALSLFIQSCELKFQRRLLTGMDPARVVSLKAFGQFLLSRQNPSSVAVVSGSVEEPEIALLRNSPQIDQLSFSENSALYDLGRDWSLPAWSEHHRKYDLVLCEQVLEHLPDPKLGVKNLAILLAPGGLLHISVPAVNNRHGEPHYYYSGFSSEVLDHWIEAAGLSREDTSSWNSDKGARMYATSDWAPLAESGPPVFLTMALRLHLGEPVMVLRILLRRLTNALRYPFQRLFSSQPTKNAVVVWSFARSPDKLPE